jgi:hypothetical protein
MNANSTELTVCYWNDSFVSRMDMTTSLGSLVWTVLSYGIRTIPLIMAIQLGWHTFRLYAIREPAATQVHLVPRFTRLSYADEVMRLFHDVLSTTLQQTPRWLRQALITMVVPEVIALIFPSFFNGNLQPFFFPAMAGLHIARMAAWLFAARGVIQSVTIR